MSRENDSVIFKLLKSADVINDGTQEISQQFDGESYPKLPDANMLELGEIALNIAKDYEVIAIKNNEGEIVYIPFNVAIRLLTLEGDVADLAQYTEESVETLSAATVSIYNNLEEFKVEISNRLVQEITSLSGNVFTTIDSLSATTDAKIAAEKERAVSAETALNILLGNLSNHLDDIIPSDTDISNKLTNKGYVDSEIKKITDVIPNDTSSGNPLTNEAFVNSSISTSTATFRGTYNLITDLHLTSAATTSEIAAAVGEVVLVCDKNDYAYVQIPTSETATTEILRIERYKYDGTAWGFEYALNNSGFTAKQWAAINSGIVAGLVVKLEDLPNKAELDALFEAKQDKLTFDNTPRYGSNNPVTSGGIKGAVDERLPLSGGTVTGDLILNIGYGTNVSLKANSNRNFLRFNDSYNGYIIGDGNVRLALETGNVDLKHRYTTSSGATDYVIVDTRNIQENLTPNLKTLNGTSIVGTGDIDIKDVYLAMYRVTPYSSITEAYWRGKAILVMGFDGIVYFLSKITLSEALFTHFDQTTMTVSSFTVNTSNVYSDITSQQLQENLVSGENIKTINNNSILGSGDIALQVPIDSSNRLDADYVDDRSSLHKFVSTEEKAKWDAKLPLSGGTMTGDIDLNGNALLVRKSGDDARYGIRFITGEGVREGIYVGNPNMRLILEADPNLDLIHKKGDYFYDILDTNNVATKGNIYQTTWGDTLDNIINAVNAGKIVILKRDITYNEQKYSPTYVLNCFVKRVSDDYITECRFYARLEDNVVAEIACKRGPTWVDNGVIQLQENLVSGTNIKTINNQSVLGSGNLDVKDVFWVEYEETPFADILAAYNAGKVLFANYAGMKFVNTVVGMEDDSNVFLFSMPGMIEGEIFISSFTVTLNNGSTDYSNIYNKKLQEELISGTNIKTINNESILGTGNVNFAKYEDTLINTESPVFNEIEVLDVSTTVYTNTTRYTLKPNQKIVLSDAVGTNKLYLIDATDENNKSILSSKTSLVSWNNFTSSDIVVQLASESNSNQILTVNTSWRGTDNVFVAEYGVTTYQEMLNAYNAGKHLFLKDNNGGSDSHFLSLEYVKLITDGAYQGTYSFRFSAIYGTRSYTMILGINGYDQDTEVLQRVLTFDNAPTAYSYNPVRSWGIKDALDNKQDKIDSTHKLNADLVDDSTSTNKFVSTTEKTAWNNKADIVDGKVQSTDGIEINSHESIATAVTVPFSDDYGQTFYKRSILKRFTDNQVVVGDQYAPDIRFEYDDKTVSLIDLVASAVLANSAYQKPQSGIPASDIANGVIPDVSQFITKSVNDLVNYYTKSETYTQSEVNTLISAINQFHYEVHPSLADITTPESNVLYLIGPKGTGTDLYEEYVYPNNTQGFTKIGDTSIDLSGYATIQALNSALQQFAQDLQTELNNYALKSQIKTVNENSLIGSGDVSIHPEIVNLTDGEHSSGYYEDLMRTVGKLKLNTPQIFLYTAYNNNHIATTAMCFSTCTNTESPTTNAVIKQTLFLGTFKSVRTLSNTVSGDSYQVVDNWTQILDIKQSDLDSKVSRAGSSMTGNLNMDYHELQVSANRNGIKFENNATGILVGNGNMYTTIQSDDADLKHRKGSTDYTILDTSNVKTINGTSINGSGDIDVNNVFWVEYYTTPFADILTAYNAGKVLFANYAGYKFVNIGAATDNDNVTTFVFSLINYDGNNATVVGFTVSLDGGTTVYSNINATDIQTLINTNNKLSADLVDDSSTTHKFVTSAQTETWNTVTEKAPLPFVVNVGINPSDVISVNKTLAELETAHNAGKIIRVQFSSASGISFEEDATRINESLVITYVAHAVSSGIHYIVTIYEENNVTKASFQEVLDSSKENVSNKVTSLSSNSTDVQYPSAKCVYDAIQAEIGAINTILDTI